MKLSLAAARTSCFVWMLWLLSTWLIFETGLLVLVICFANLPIHRLIGPYFALFVAPAAAGPLIYRANRRRANDSKLGAREMAIATTLFIELINTALSYSSVKLGLSSVSFALTTMVVAWLLSGPIVYFAAYRLVLAKAAEGSPRPT
jgi:hypothetical protein